MKLLYVIYIATIITAISCAGDTKVTTPPVIDSYARYCQTDYQENQKNKNQKYKEYYLNNEATDSVRIDALISQGLVKHYYQALKREAIESKKESVKDGVA